MICNKIILSNSKVFMRFFVLKICFFLFSSLSIFGQNDTLTLNVEELILLVKQYHPIVKQANINYQKSTADISIAKGAFNPVISNVISGKTFGATNYYNYINPQISIPTWYGIEVTAGLENLSGNRFDPSETVGKSSYIGLSFPLLKNLVLDKRRAYLQQAKLYQNMAQTEQNAVLNAIILDAAVEYWEWANAYKVYEIVEKNFKISQQRYEMVKKAYFNGERPAIDTVEAQSQMQSFELQKNDSWLKFQNETLALSAFLWKENNVAYLLSDKIIPAKNWENEENIQNVLLNLNDLQIEAQRNHPELQLYNQKLAVLGIDKKLKFQEMLPKLDFKYNHLSKGYNVFYSDGFAFQNNYQYGLKFEMPLLFSAGRGEYKKSLLKIEETQIAQNQKSFGISLKVNNYFNEYLTLKKQIFLQRAMLGNLQKLLKGEETLFFNGESSLFLINSRENKVLENEVKLTELKAKFYKSIYKLQWSAGLLK